MEFIGTIKGEFTETQSVHAENEEEAKRLFAENAGETIDRSATGELEVSRVEEVK